MGADTLNSDYVIILRGRAIMAEAAGNYYAANSYGKRYNNLKETLNKQLLESRAHEYAARYHLQEEEMKVESEKRKVESGKRMIIGLAIFALIAIGLIIQLLFLRKSIDRKNKVLAEQLAKAVKVTDDRPKGKGETEDAVSENLTPSTSEPVDPEMSDEELFDHLAEAIRNEKLFLDNNFGRDTLMARFHLNERQVGAAFSKGSPYASIADFSRELRLEYACQLLTECPDMSISEIAATCGYGSPVAFNRAFKAKYEITPSYYREEVTINR